MKSVAAGLSALGQWRRATLFVTLLTALGYGASLLRERANASAFGTSGELDAFLVASSVISLLAITPSRALYEGLVLAIAGPGEDRHDVAVATARAAIGVGILVLVGISAIALAITPGLVRAVAPEMSSASILEAERLARVLAPTILVLGLWEIARGVLHGLHEFFRSSVVPIVAPLLTFAAVTTLSGSLGIDSLALGTILGTAFQALVGLVLVVRMGIPLRPSRTLFDLNRVRALGGAVTASATLTGIGLLWVAVDRLLGSGLPEGRISALSYASRVFDVLSVLAVTGTATIAFPRFARFAHATSNEFWGLVRRAVLEITLIATALMLIFVMLARPLIHLLFGTGRFDAESERVTTEAFLAYVVFLPLTAPAGVIARAVYALGKLRLLVSLSAFALLTKIALGLVLREPLEHVGIAAASGIATVIGSGLLLVAAIRTAQGSTRGSSVEG